jgi:Flp pilus assembly protein TadD
VYRPPLLVFLATAALFTPALAGEFLNWDDIDLFVRNDALRAPGLVRWAFTTRYMEHYQPLAWLTWGALQRTAGLTPATAHALSVVLHASCAALLYAFIRRYAGAWAAAAAALLWAMHPLRVEVVAWSSAMPYSLALLFALLSMGAWLDGRSWTAVAWFAVSLLARPIAFAMPLLWLFVMPASAGQPWRPAFAGVTLAIAAAIAESSARLTATLDQFGIGPRLTLAASAPWRYLWRTIAPVNLTPLDPLALTPRTDAGAIALGIAGVALLSFAAWHWRREQPVLAIAWLAYLALLVPAMGLVPSGLQATADRYTYFPAVAISVAAAVVAHAGATTRVETWKAGLAGLAIASFAVLTWQQLHHWRDSIALWTRAVEIDARNDVALYNLGSALAAAGRADDALARYEQVLALVPTHAEARHNRDLLRARQLEDDGNGFAAGGRLAEAVTRYAQAVRLDPRRTHSQAALGMALTQLGRTAEARPHLQAALDQGVNDPSIANALAFGLAQAGDRQGAVAVLQAAQRRFPNDANIARNLAMLERR